MKKKLIKKIANRNKHEAGFTLIETLVAVFVLTLSITGPVYIASLAFRNTIDSRDNISAQYLAEEVIEVLRNRRDKNILNDSIESNWLNNITGSGVNCLNDFGENSNKCTMNRDSSLSSSDKYVFEQCSAGNCSQISFDPDGNDAVYGSVNVSDISKFTREFYIEKSESSDKEVKIVVNITWLDKGNQKKYTLNERLHALNYINYFK